MYELKPYLDISSKIDKLVVMLVDIIVRDHKVVAAKPPKNIGTPPPIILVRTEGGNVMPVIKWNEVESYGCKERLENRVFGRLRGAALQEALRVVGNNGGLDIPGEYGSIEIEDNEFEADSKLQDEMNSQV